MIAKCETEIAAVAGKSDEYSLDARSYEGARLRGLKTELRAALTADIPLSDLSALCDAWREGRCVVLPCKVGEKLSWKDGEKIKESIVRWFETIDTKGKTIWSAAVDYIQWNPAVRTLFVPQELWIYPEVKNEAL